MRALGEICLTVEEAEAIRLKDLEGLGQEGGAEKMNISRPTFQRVLASARQKIAGALLNGRAIRIDGGNFEMSPHRFRCANNHEWEAPFELALPATPQFCPVCNEPGTGPLVPAGLGWSGRGRGGHRGGHSG